MRWVCFIGATILMVFDPCKVATAAPGDLLFKLTAPDPQPGAAFGKVLAAVDGDILVGEPARLELPIDAPGRAYLFDGRTGAFKVTFDNPEPTNQDVFAGALTGGDGRVFISTSGLTDRIYAYSTATGEVLDTIYDPEGTSNNFGTGVAYGNGSLVASSAYPRTTELLGAGRGYLFDAANGQLEHTLPNPEPKRGDVFGSGASLAVFGNRVVIGAMLDDLPGDDAPDGENPGRVWVFDRNSGDVVFTLENPNPETLPPLHLPDWFGYSVAANEEIIVVGAQEDGTSGIPGSGTVYVFDSNTGNLLHTLLSPQLESNGEFGHSVAVTPNGNVLVGAWGTSVSGIEAAGRVYLFDGLTGNLLLDIPNPEPTEFADFGWSVAALDNRIVVGAFLANADGLPSVGRVYVFASVPEPSTAYLFGMFFVVFCFSYFCRHSLIFWLHSSNSRRLESCDMSETS